MKTTTTAEQIERVREALAWTHHALDRAHTPADAFDLRRDVAALTAELRDLEDVPAPELTSDDIDAMAARDAERAEIDRVEGRILSRLTPAHVNIHP